MKTAKRTAHVSATRIDGRGVFVAALALFASPIVVGIFRNLVVIVSRFSYIFSNRHGKIEICQLFLYNKTNALPLKKCCKKNICMYFLKSPCTLHGIEIILFFERSVNIILDKRRLISTFMKNYQHTIFIFVCRPKNL